MANKGPANPNRFWNRKRYAWLALAIIFVAGLIVYSNTFRVPFQYEDTHRIVKNQTLRSMKAFADLSYWTDLNNAPFSMLTLALNYQAGPSDTTGYHIVNFLIHILGAFLVYLLTRLILIRRDENPDWNRHFIHRNAMFVALIFLLHPLQTMGVTYISGRISSLTGLLYILTVYLYLKGRLAYTGEGAGVKGIRLLVLSGVSGILAILSGPLALTLPLTLIFTELYFVRSPEGRSCKKYLSAGFPVAIILSVVLLLPFALASLPGDLSYGEYLLSQPGAFLRYVRLLFVPAWQNVDHGLGVDGNIGFAEISGSLVIVALVLITIRLFKKQPVISYGLLWFLLTLVVASLAYPGNDALMENRVYLSLAGFSLFLVAGVYSLGKDQRLRMADYGFVIVIIVLAILAYQRNEVWKSKLTLWEDSVGKNPANPRGLTNLGLALVREQEYPSALEKYNKAIQHDTSFYTAYLNRGLMLFDLGKYELAIKDLNKALRGIKDTDIPYFFRGVSHAHLEHYPEAIKDLTRAIEINPRFAGSYKNRGVVYEKTHNYRDARADYDKVLKLNPENKKVLVNRARTYFMNMKYREALEDIREAEKHGIEVDENFIDEILDRIANPPDDSLQYFINRKENVKLLPE
ncbi:MAG: tetratricopeptide repeat protein [Bacteroidales bacterium]